MRQLLVRCASVGLSLALCCGLASAQYYYAQPYPVRSPNAYPVGYPPAAYVPQPVPVYYPPVGYPPAGVPPRSLPPAATAVAPAASASPASTAVADATPRRLPATLPDAAPAVKDIPPLPEPVKAPPPESTPLPGDPRGGAAPAKPGDTGLLPRTDLGACDVDGAPCVDGQCAKPPKQACLLPTETMIGDIGWNAWRLADPAGPYVPLSGVGAFKVSENNSPIPLNRVYATYNYYNGVTDGSSRAFDIHRETFGFERAFLDGRASIEMRLPVFHQIGDDFNRNMVGDLTVVLKLAPYLNRQTGDVLSGGLAVTAPTGPAVELADGSHLYPTLLQPWVGGRYNAGRSYLMGYSAVVVPTANQDVMLWTTDVGVGYRAYAAPGQFLSGISPTFEFHSNTPLNHHGLSNGLPLAFPDELFVVTGGVHFILCDRGQLTFGAATPLSGPRAYEVQGVVQFNMFF
jgi:hypothetical protein